MREIEREGKKGRDKGRVGERQRDVLRKGKKGGDKGS